MGLMQFLAKRRWQGAMPGDKVLFVTTGQVDFVAGGTQGQSRAAIVLGTSNIGFGLYDMRNAVANTVVIPRADIVSAIARDGRTLVFSTRKGGRFTLSSMSPSAFQRLYLALPVED